MFHQRDFVVPYSDVIMSRNDAQLSRRADQIGDYPLVNPEHFIPMDVTDWNMPAGFDDRDFFLTVLCGSGRTVRIG